MVSATTPDPLALDLWTPPRTTSMVRSIPGEHAAKAGVAAGGLPVLPNLEMVEEYVRDLEKERSKVEAFRRELPLCMLILTHVIEELKEELARRGRIEAEQMQRKNCQGKASWMSSTQVWNFNGAASNASSDAAIRDIDGGKVVAGEAGTDELPSQQAPRKARRCWSAELHRRFVSAIEQLGGSQAATPKQIRRLMKVDGLTNDEVKSHLQKYRLRRQRLLPGSSSSSAAQPDVLWGGLKLVTRESPPVEKRQRTTHSAGSPSARQH